MNPNIVSRLGLSTQAKLDVNGESEEWQKIGDIRDPKRHVADHKVPVGLKHVLGDVAQVATFVLVGAEVGFLLLRKVWHFDC